MVSQHDQDDRRDDHGGSAAGRPEPLPPLAGDNCHRDHCDQGSKRSAPGGKPEREEDRHAHTPARANPGDQRDIGRSLGPTLSASGPPLFTSDSAFVLGGDAVLLVGPSLSLRPTLDATEAQRLTRRAVGVAAEQVPPASTHTPILLRPD